MLGAFDQRRYLIPFRATLLPQIFTDVLVIGSGVAGLNAALTAAENADVIVLAKGKLHQSNTAWAQGGVAIVQDDQDNFDAHVKDTLDAGGGLCDTEVVRNIIEAGPGQLERMVEFGLPLDRDARGAIQLGREGGHTAHRIVHCDGDSTGKAVSQTLIQTAQQHEHIRLFDGCFALDLITEGDSGTRCIGAITHHPKYGLQVIWAKATILASGGSGQVYRETTNAPVATGDGLAMAYRAGAAVMDMEFIQFHPTTLYIAGAARSLISEAVRGEGAYLVNRSGKRFMLDEHELAELAPRDIVSRAILKQMAMSPNAHVHLDARHIGTKKFAERFPGIYQKLRQFELDPGENLIPIAPACHYQIGGIYADQKTRTTVPGLLACGEVACTGLHGANRLASNSLLEGMVCGQRAGEQAMELIEEPLTLPIKIVSDIPISERSELDIPDVRSSLRSVMWRHVGIEREGQRLTEIAEMFEFWARYTLDKIFDERDGWQVQNQLYVGALITHAALRRVESRGTHYRMDHPERDEQQLRRYLWQRDLHEPRIVPGTSVGGIDLEDLTVMTQPAHADSPEVA